MHFLVLKYTFTDANKINRNINKKLYLDKNLWKYKYSNHDLIRSPSNKKGGQASERGRGYCILVISLL